MAVRNNIGRIKSSLENISRQVKLFDGITQYGLGTTEAAVEMTSETADDVSGDQPNKNFIWGVHRWATTSYKVGK